ncbi:hypothetical protein ACFW9D_18685, partial [Streptomyces sp. NPDC059524]|uniref:hypothetical protein n=1 Tax=Streptomyces sp. NPDC059524 TaxID=3346856 RepID=UPI0036919AC7
MTLAVESCDLTGFATLVHRASEDFKTARTYLSRHTSIEFAIAATAWDLAYGDHAQQVRAAEDVLTRFETILDASHRELDKTAGWYESVDLKEAQKLDATYPAPRKGPVPRQRPSGSTTFKDVCDALEHLKPAGGADGWFASHRHEFDFAPVNKTVGTLFDLGSPSALVNEGLKLAFDVDVLGTVSNWLAGDWQNYVACADAWDCLGNFCDAAAKNIRHGNEVLGLTWRGNAADAAWKYFERMANTLESAGDTFHALREHYTGIAKIVFSFADLAKGIVASICDRAAEAAIAAAASPAIATTGVGVLGSL